jgi:broad specificity phosphatase PhoE
MTTIYIARHAQAEGNLTRRFQGVTDTLLTEKGIQQTAYLAKRFENIPLDAVYASPLKRALHTAERTAAPHGLTPVVWDSLKEIDGGLVENMLFEELEAAYPGAFKQFTEESHAFPGFGGGESMKSVYERVTAAILKIAKENPGGTVLAVSHGCAIRCLLCFLAGMPLEEMGTLPWGGNTCVAKAEFDEALNPTLIFHSDDSHLPVELRHVLAVTEAEKKALKELREKEAALLENSRG